MTDLDMGIPAIVGFALFGLCLSFIVVWMIRAAPKFEYIWLYPLGFAIFRMVILACLAAEGFGLDGGLVKQTPEWIASLLLGFYGKLALLGPAITIYTRGSIVNPTFAEDRRWFRWAYAEAQTVRERSRTVFAFHLPNIATATLQYQRAAGGPVIPPVLLRVLDIATPAAQILFDCLICFWIFYTTRWLPRVLDRFPIDPYIYVLAVFMNIANGYQFAERLTEGMLSLWYFWGFQVLVELIMTVIIIYAIIAYTRFQQAKTECEASWHESYALKLTQPDPSPNATADELTLKILGSQLDWFHIPRPNPAEWVPGDASGEVRAMVRALGWSEEQARSLGIDIPASSSASGIVTAPPPLLPISATATTSQPPPSPPSPIRPIPPPSGPHLDSDTTAPPVSVDSIPVPPSSIPPSGFPPTSGRSHLLLDHPVVRGRHGATSSTLVRQAREKSEERRHSA